MLDMMDTTSASLSDTPTTLSDAMVSPAGLLHLAGRFPIRIDHTRDSLLTEFGKLTLTDRYLLPGETFQALFARVATYYADDQAHAQRLYDYISQLWFMPATPVLSNGGTDRGLPISCFLNEVNDNLESIFGNWVEDGWLAAKGGGLGIFLGNIRSIGEKVGSVGKTSGIVPFIRVMDAITLAISQGSLRRGSAAVYLPVSHPEIKEFIDIRKPTGGDPNRKAPNLHIGVQIPDAFMQAVVADALWELTSPRTGEVIDRVAARDIWIRMLTSRVETGEPYLVFSDHVNKARPAHHKQAGLIVKSSNLCSEITLPTGIDHHGNERTAVCCLSSLNLEHWHAWEDHPTFILDVMRFLDNVLQDFIDRAPSEMQRATYAAMRERSVGLGVMGFHSFLQSMNVPWESVMAKVWNKKLFRHIRAQADAASVALAVEKGPCPDAAEFGVMERFSHKLSIAPTASISIIAGNSSPGIEPIAANVFLQKTLSGSTAVRNRHLQRLLAEKGMDTDEIWSSITTTKGSVQHLDFLSEHEKLVYRTAFELDQRWVIEHAADRTPFICQSQSVNVFLPANVHKRDLHQIHMLAWKRGLKSLYYCRSLSIARADTVSNKAVAPLAFTGAMVGATAEADDRPREAVAYNECLSCQ